MPRKKNKRKAIQIARKVEVADLQTKRGRVGVIAHSSIGGLGMAMLAAKIMMSPVNRLPENDREADDEP